MTSDDRDSNPPDGAADTASDEGGLEIDERQVREMRSIFGASLPQYIEPLEQTAHHIISRNADADVVRTFSASAASLREAAEKLGFADVAGMISELEDSVIRVASEPGEVPRDSRLAVLGLLDDLRRLGEQLGGPQERVHGTSLVERLAGMPDAGPIVIQLARAGLVLDEQLLAGRPDEIAAVSGLAAPIVARVLAWLRGEPALEAVAPPPAPAAPPLRAVGDAEARRDDGPMSADEKLARELAALEAAGARLEARLEEVRIDLGRGRERLESLRLQQTAVDADTGDLRDRLAAERELRARALDDARKDLQRLREQVTAIRRSVESEETNVASARTALGSLERMISEIQARASRSGP